MYAGDVALRQVLNWPGQQLRAEGSADERTGPAQPAGTSCGRGLHALRAGINTTIEGMNNAIGIDISAVALAVSVFTLFYTRRRDRRDVFLRLHEQLITDDAQRGRFLLLATEGPLSAMPDEDFRCIKRALARYDLLGLYVKKKQVRKADVMALWAEPLFLALKAAPDILTYTEEKDGYRPWSFFFWLARQAEKHLYSHKSPIVAEDRHP
jgi:hypothetical protein